MLFCTKYLCTKFPIFREGLNTDNGVYTAQPFQRKAESPPLVSDDGGYFMQLHFMHCSYSINRISFFSPFFIFSSKYSSYFI